MNPRDELAKLLTETSRAYIGEYGAYVDEVEAPHLADAILAAGYSKPHTITTATELDAIEAAADAIAQDDRGACECRRSSYDKHDINPPCSGRRRAVRVARAALEAAAPYLMADMGQLLFDANRMIALLVLESGGEITITRRAVTDRPVEIAIETETDASTGGWVIRTRVRNP